MFLRGAALVESVIGRWEDDLRKLRDGIVHLEQQQAANHISIATAKAKIEALVSRLVMWLESYTERKTSQNVAIDAVITKAQTFHDNMAKHLP